MPKKRLTATPSHPPEFCFVEQLKGENPPSLSAMKVLYDLALQQLALLPWTLLEEDQLILVRRPDSEDYCYCSVMGAAGEFFSTYAYVGSDSYALFLKASTDDEFEPADFLASGRSVFVEFVPIRELEAPDRAVLSALGIAVGRGRLVPKFRAIRPGYHSWFVTAEEAALLTVCLGAVTVMCSEMSDSNAHRYWPGPGIFPLLVPQAETWHVELKEPVVPAEPVLAPVRLDAEVLTSLRKQDYPIRGVVELDHLFTTIQVGGRNERKACLSLALAVDRESGFLFAPGLTSPPDAGESLGKALCGAITASNAFPVEICLRSQRVRDCIAGVAETLGLPLRVVPRLPALDEAREGLLELMAR